MSDQINLTNLPCKVYDDAHAHGEIETVLKALHDISLPGNYYETIIGKGSITWFACDQMQETGIEIRLNTKTGNLYIRCPQSTRISIEKYSEA